MAEIVLMAWRAIISKGQAVKGLMGLMGCLVAVPGYIRRGIVSLRRIAIALERIADTLGGKK